MNEITCTLTWNNNHFHCINSYENIVYFPGSWNKFIFFLSISADSPSTKDIEDFISKKSNTNAKLLQIDLKDKVMLANNMREACLPKLLCEIAAKPANVVTEKEQSLLDLIR